MKITSKLKNFVDEIELYLIIIAAKSISALKNFPLKKQKSFQYAKQFSEINFEHKRWSSPKDFESYSRSMHHKSSRTIL